MSYTKRIILINPPTSGSTYEWIEQLGSKLPFIGLCSLAAYIRKQGFETQLLDAYNLGLTPKAALSQVLKFSPTHVGITAMSSDIGFAADFAELVKRSHPRVVTIIGGTHITSMPEETMERFPYFDIGVLGEGEETLKEILTLPADREHFDGVKGIIYRDKNGGLKKTDSRQFIKDLDQLPYPAWDLLPDFPLRYRLTPTNF